VRLCRKRLIIQTRPFGLIAGAMKWLFIGISVFGAAAAGTASADTRFVPPAPNQNQFLNNYAHIVIYGEIKAADLQTISKYVKLMQAKDPSPMMMPKVSLDSGGGDLLAAIEIGKFLRKSNAWTMVDGDAKCASACIFVLASGVIRQVFEGAVLGLHRPRFDQEMFSQMDAANAKLLYNSLIERCRVYLREMGMTDQLLEDMLRVSSSDVVYQDREYAQNVLLDGKDPAYQEWQSAVFNQMIERMKAENAKSQH